VRDYGQGISEVDRQNLFKPYFKSQDEASIARNRISHGIGLNICKKLAVGLGGDLTLTQGLTTGSEFILQLKLDRPTAEIQN